MHRKYKNQTHVSAILMYMKKIFIFFKKYILLPLFIIVAIFIISLIVVKLVTKPSNTRTWNDDQSILPFSEIDGNKVSVHNIRDFMYASTTSYNIHYYDKTFDTNTIKKVWYIVEPFSGVPGSAHTFLSFEFENNQFLSISIEIRKEKGESFNPIKGIFNQYELTYVIADEKDVIKLRSNYRKDTVYLYPAKGTQEGFKLLLLDMLSRTNTLKEHPEFYNTITNNCTTNIVKHVNKVSSGSIPFFTLQAIFPEYSDKLAYELGLIDSTLPFEEARARYRINDRAIKYTDDINFSIKIREE